MLRVYVIGLVFLATASMLSLVLEGADGAAILVDETSLTYSPASPLHSDPINVSAKVVVSKAIIGEDGVVLKHSLCTETYCGLPETTVMVLDSSSGLYKATIGPFPERDSLDETYLYVRFHVEATGDPTDGTTGPIKAASNEVKLYFQERPDDTDDDDTDGKESPFPLLALSPLLLSPLLRRSRKRV
jgi:hypothetical protein